MKPESPVLICWLDHRKGRLVKNGPIWDKKRIGLDLFKLRNRRDLQQFTLSLIFSFSIKTFLSNLAESTTDLKHYWHTRC